MKSVLFVDDEPRLLDGLKRLLRPQRTEWEMLFAGSGEEALSVMERQQVDILVTDMRMPEMDGIEATRQIRQIQPDAKIIALTSYDGDQDIYKAIEAGVRGYILKEMVHTKVIDAIRTVHDGKRLMPQEVAERLSALADGHRVEH